MHRADNLDVAAKVVLAVGVASAIYLIAVPLAMLLFAAFRGPADHLPFEPGARWTIEHVRALFTDPVVVSNGHYVLPSHPGYSAELHEESIERYEFPTGTYWLERSAEEVLVSR